MNHYQNNNKNTEIKTLHNAFLNQVDDYKYIGSYTSSSEKDFNARIHMA